MSLFGAKAEYGLHCLLSLVDVPEGAAVTAKDAAEFQGISPSYVAKLFTGLERAGLVVSVEGARGGFRLARPADEINLEDIVDALEGHKSLFKCREIRSNCVLYGDNPPASATQGVCSIHAVMLEAEARMRDVLRATTLGGLDRTVGTKMSPKDAQEARDWFAQRVEARSKPRNVKQVQK